MLSEMVKGIKLEDALKITPDDIMKELGGLPKEKIHCSVLGDKALRKAANDYFRKSGQKNRIIKENEMVCECLSVTREEIEEHVSHGISNYEKIQEITKVGTGCGKCENAVRDLIDKFKKIYKI
jgi:nitrogen fixation NifU-like protein